MDVLIVHYHLNPGGVTNIIESQIKALKNTGSLSKIALLCGNSNKTTHLSGISVKENQLLDYHIPSSALPEQKSRLSAIVSLIIKNTAKSTVIHFHNPNLGKNPLLTAAVYMLAKAGFAIVNHCHDFAEDRPANVDLLDRVIPEVTGTTVNEVLYPNYRSYHFVVINSCDYKRLIKQGISGNRVHMLQNPVLPPDYSSVVTAERKKFLKQKLGLDPGKLLCTYPVRVIRRKNIGEFILLAVIFSGKAGFVVTLPPRNPEEILYYNRWKEFCQENAIDVIFEAGETIDFKELLAISDFCVTTSIKEGFGMVFLEPWLVGTPVIGRSIPCVIQDLQQSGLEFPRLYGSIIVNERDTDFKDFDPDQQENFIAGIMKSPEKKLKLLNDNPFIESFLDYIPGEIIRKNRDIVLERFSINQYGKELLGIYSEISQ
jgi:glycosyltransferase involved in cell wall biosynthesis